MRHRQHDEVDGLRRSSSTAHRRSQRNTFRTRIWLPATAMLGLAASSSTSCVTPPGSWAAQTGATTEEQMASLGHSSTRSAMIYQHSSAGRDRRIVERDRRIAERPGAMVDQERCRVRKATAEPRPARGARVRHNGLSAVPRPAP